MLGIHDYWLFVATGIVLNLTPGQDTLYIISSGIASGSSGLSFARRSARSTVRLRLSSSRMFVDDDARRLPIVDVTVMSVFVVPPLVVISFPAKRVLPLHPLTTVTRVSSAALSFRTRSVIARACPADSGRSRGSASAG